MAFKDVQAHVDSNQLELGVLEFWEKENIFEKSLEQNKDKEEFVFYDGPPYATGKPHYGHILQSTIKDTVLRYKTMRGHYIPRKVGWDTHGLPVEVIVEKELGFKTKKEIEEFGIEKFNAKCREVVTRFVDDFTNSLKRLGRWASYDEAYFTLDRDYMEKEWEVFKTLWEKDLVYKDFRSTPYCLRCETALSNHEVSMAYKDKVDETVFVKLKVKENLSLLVWTTTPWTLPANVGVAVSPDLEYVSVKHEDEELVVAKDLVEKIFGKDAVVTKTWSQEELLQLTYKPLWDFFETENAFRVVVGDHVTAEDGTGLVHMAPAFGQEDFEVGKKEGLPTLRTITKDGKFMDEVKPWAGELIWDANRKIVADLEDKGVLFKKEHYKHSYPHCWRCDEPLIYFALDSWFVGVSKIKDQLIAAAEKINWTPDHVKNGRFLKGLESAPDWAVSRSRYWSVPLPVWQCGECEEQVCVGSVAELSKLSGAENVEDLHRPFVDDIKWPCGKCSGEMVRVEDVLDVWFDSGSMPYATSDKFPADFIVEAIEMTRAWFYVLHVLATAMKGEPAFRNVIASGLIFDEKGRKLSKKLKNYKEPEPIFEEYGADSVRLYFLTSSTLGEPYRFSEKDLKKLKQNVYLTLWNVYSFFVRYANTHNWLPPENTKSKTQNPNLLDKWILTRMTQLENDLVQAADAYQIDKAARLLLPFIDDLSNWYVRRSRARFQQSMEPEAFVVLHDVLVRTAKIIAPFAPFLAEEMYQNLTGKESVHLAQLQPEEISERNEAALQQMAQAREVVSQALAARAAAGVKIRQPLSKLLVKGEDLGKELSDIIQDEVNVKQIVYDEGQEEPVILDTEITDELKAEGLAREIIRHGQQLRRKAGYNLDDKIIVAWESSSELVKNIFASQAEVISAALQATELAAGIAGADEETEIKLEGEVLRLGVKK